MATDLKSDAARQAAGLEAATPPGAFAPARATPPRPPEIAPPDFLRPLPSHTLSLSAEGRFEGSAAEVDNRSGVGGDACDLEVQVGLCCRWLERLRSRSQTELLEVMDGPSVAMLVDVGFVDTTPLTFTRPGWRWARANGDAARRNLLRGAYLRRVAA